MQQSKPRLQLDPGRWYGWQMLPGYDGRNVPYFSPILIERVTPRKTGKSILGLQFRNALYAAGVQGFGLDIRIVIHDQNYLVAELLYEPSEIVGRTGIISHIEFEWIRRFCPDLWAERPPEAFGPAEQGSVSLYLRSLFGS